MASKGHIARLREEALATLQSTNQQMAAALDIEPPSLEIFFRDPELLHATHLHELARFSERLFDRVGTLAIQLADAQTQLAEQALQLEAQQAPVNNEPANEEPAPKPTRSKKGK